MENERYLRMLEFIHSIPWMGKKLGLLQVSELLERMGNPQDRLQFIHVAGTNGKGSTCEMLARMLEAAGYRVGFFVSPYIRRFNERIQINHRPIEDDALADLIGCIKGYAEQMAVMPSEFEVVTAIAFQHFLDNGCDYVVLEVGMGGRLDATNVIRTPLAAVITTIGLDHTRFLGDTVRQIAYEKAGIIKPGGDVVVYGQGGEAAEVFDRVCRERGASLSFSDFSAVARHGEDEDYQYFSYKDSDIYALPLLGEHQLRNAATALETALLLNRKGVSVPETAIKAGLRAAAWPGRFEILSKDPPVVVDGGHNPEGARAAAQTFRHRFPGKKAVIVIGMTEGKDFGEVGGILNEIASCYVVVQADNGRSMPKAELAEALRVYRKPVKVADSVAEGVRLALEIRGENEAVLSAGSLYTVAEVRAYFGRE